MNDAGAFEAGGPEGDNGLSGKKLVADAYGPRVPIGGGRDLRHAGARLISKLAAIVDLISEAAASFRLARNPRGIRLPTLGTFRVHAA